MKKKVHCPDSWSYIQFAILASAGLLATLTVVVVSATSAQNAGSTEGSTHLEQKKSKPYPSRGAQEKFQPVRLMPKALPGPVKLEGAELAGIFPKSLTANALINNNNNGMSDCTLFTQSTTSTVSFGDTIVCGFNDSGSDSFGPHVTGWSRSTDRGVTWTDGGQFDR